MNTTLRINRKIILIIAFILLIIGVGVAVYLLSQQQDVRQRAAGGADLVVKSVQLTDAAGNVKTKFWENEDIYVKVTLGNDGDTVGTSSNGRTITQVYSNRASPVAFDTVSDVEVALDNGQFQPDTQKTYESRLRGTGQNAYVEDPYDDNPTRKYSWRRTQGGSFTARILINSNKAVTETNYDNNQATLSYQVVPFTDADEIGTQSLTKPAGFDDYECETHNSQFITGLTGCIQKVQGPDTKVQGRVTNNTSQTVTVGIASYKAYLPYISPSCSSTQCPDQYNFTWTQTFYRAELYDLRAGETVYLSTNVPPCAWQADIFVNGVPKSFHPNIDTYNGIGFVDGWYHFYPNYDQENTNYCNVVSPSPTPTIPVTPSTPPSATPTTPPGVTPTVSPTTPPLTPSPTVIPTVSPTACPTPGKVLNVRIVCPNCTQ